MPGRRDDVEECTAERELALTRIACAWALVLAILFWATSSPEDWPVRFSIQWSFGADAASMRDAASTRDDAPTRQGVEMVPGPGLMGRQVDALAGVVSMNRVPELLRCGMRRLVGYGRESVDEGVSGGASPAGVELVASFVRHGRARVRMQMIVTSSEARD